MALLSSTLKIIKYKLFSNKEFDDIYINIKTDDLSRIMSDRSKAVQSGVLHDPVNVDADLEYNGEIYKARLRLKGDLADHWGARHRMSLRVRLKGGKTIFGFSRFSIHKPRARQHPYDFVFQRLVKSLGNISTEHKYAHLYVNGVDWGIMDFEEHMSDELLEKQNKKESIIVRFSNEDKWLYNRTNNNPYSAYRLSHPIFNVHLYNEKNKLLNEWNRKAYTYITNGRLNNGDELYDASSFSKAYILSRLWGSDHAVRDSNSRYYFNPYTLKLEPITTDQTPWNDINIPFKLNKQYKVILESQNYIRNIEDNLLAVNDVLLKIDNIMKEVQSFFPVDREKNTSQVKSNIEQAQLDKRILLPKGNISNKKDIDKIILPTEKQASGFTTHVHVNHFFDGRIWIYNLLPDIVKIKKISLNGAEQGIDNEILLPGYGEYINPVIVKTPFKGIQDGKIIVTTEYQGFTKKSNNGISLFSNKIKNPLLLNSVPNKGFIKRIASNQYRIESGEWVITEPVIINGSLHIEPNTRVYFSKNAYFIIKGALIINGSNDGPVVLDSVKDSWKGIYVLEAKKKSYIRNAVIRNIESLKDGLLQLAGGITFYKSDIEMENVEIYNVEAGDAINIVDSNFKINSLRMENVSSNGLKLRSSKGKLIDLNLLNIKDDAVSLIGSDVSINFFNGLVIGDEGVSSDGNSIVNIMNSSILDVGTGISSKNGSKVHASDVLVRNYKHHAAVSIIDKSFYSAPSMNIIKFNVNQSAPYMKHEKALMLVDGVGL